MWRRYSTLSSLDFSTNMTTSDWKNWYNSTDVVSGTTMSYFSSSVNAVTNNSNPSTCHLLRYLRRQWLRRLEITVFFAAWKKLFNYCTIVRRISLVYVLVHWCDLFNISKSWPVTLPNDTTAGFPLMLPPPVEVSLCAAAAGRKHMARRRRQNDVGLGH